MATSFYLVGRSGSRDIGRLMGAEADETLIIDSLEAAALTIRRRSVLPSSARTSWIHRDYHYHHHLLDEGLVTDGHGLNIIERVPSLPRLSSSRAAGSMVKTELYHYDDQDHCTTCCAVCLEEFCDGMEVSRLPCCHVFHSACIGKWFLRKISCPMCRRELHLHY